jgi:hypothetical protein
MHRGDPRVKETKGRILFEGDDAGQGCELRPTGITEPTRRAVLSQLSTTSHAHTLTHTDSNSFALSSPGPNISPYGLRLLAALDLPPSSYSLHNTSTYLRSVVIPLGINTGANPPFQPLTSLHNPPPPSSTISPCHRVCYPPSGTSYPVRILSFSFLFLSLSLSHR